MSAKIINLNDYRQKKSFIFDELEKYEREFAKRLNKYIAAGGFRIPSFVEIRQKARAEVEKRNKNVKK